MTTQRVRVRLLMNAEGKWTAYGWNDATPDEADQVLYDMMADNDVASARIFWLVADVELPQPIEIPAAIEEEPPAMSYLPPRRKRAKMGVREPEQRVFEGHRKFLRSHMCAISGCAGAPIEVAHLRTAANSGTGLKPADWNAAPLCRAHHARGHQIGHDAMARENGTTLDALVKIAAWLASRSPDKRLREAMRELNGAGC